MARGLLVLGLLVLGLLVLGLGGLLACGGGGGGGTGSTPPPQQPAAADISGAWTATAGGTTYHVLVLPGTLAFRSLDSNVLEGSGTFTLSGNTLGGSIVIFPNALYLAGGYPKQTGAITGTASGTAINDTITVPLGKATNALGPDTAANVRSRPRTWPGPSWPTPSPMPPRDWAGR
jgi:hypothetical protein